MKPQITIWHHNNHWHARSDGPHQGYVAGTAEVVLLTARDWLQEAEPDQHIRIGILPNPALALLLAVAD